VSRSRSRIRNQAIALKCEISIRLARRLILLDHHFLVRGQGNQGEVLAVHVVHEVEDAGEAAFPSPQAEGWGRMGQDGATCIDFL